MYRGIEKLVKLLDEEVSILHVHATIFTSSHEKLTVNFHRDSDATEDNVDAVCDRIELTFQNTELNLGSPNSQSCLILRRSTSS